MATRLRLQRHGKKGKPFFHLVAADQRTKRDGRFIEKLGVYNPNTNPATIDISFDRCLHWVELGAQPSDTVRAILSYKGVLMRDHLNRGVKKGAMTQAQADKKFEAWMQEKADKVASNIDGISKKEQDARAAALKAEAEVNEKRRSELEAKAAEEAAAAQAAEATEEAPAAEATEETPAAEATEEAPAADATEAADKAE